MQNSQSDVRACAGLLSPARPLRDAQPHPSRCQRFLRCGHHWRTEHERVRCHLTIPLLLLLLLFILSPHNLPPPAHYRYCASKWALEGWSDSIRREFRCWGIKVSKPLALSPQAMPFARARPSTPRFVCVSHNRAFDSLHNRASVSGSVTTRRSVL